MMDYLHRMAVFQSVATAGSFRGAAKELGISPSVVSHHIAQLEAQLDLPLIYRSTRRLSLTDAGVELLQSTQRMTQAAEAGLAAMQRRKNNVSGGLRITAPAISQHPAFGGALIDFAKEFPSIKLDISYTDDFEKLSGSAFDLALRGTAVDMEDSIYKSRRVAAFDIWVVASPSYVRDRDLPRTLEEIEEWDRVKHPPGINLSHIADTFEEIAEPNASIVVNGMYAAIHCACAGLGFLVVPGLAVKEEVERGQLIRICADAVFKPINIYAVWPQNVPKNSLVHLAVDFIEAYYKRSKHLTGT